MCAANTTDYFPTVVVYDFELSFDYKPWALVIYLEQCDEY